MVNDKKTYDAADVYRQYQGSRDNIPSSVLSRIRSEADQALNEGSIHSLVEAAKVASYTSEKDVSAAKKESWFSSVANQIKMAVSPHSKPLGTAFACLVLVAVLVPMLGDFRASNSFSETSHLQDCAQCSSYLGNALATTRGPGIGSNNSEAKIAAQIGLIQALLKIETSQDSPNASRFSNAQINRLSEKVMDAELSALIASGSSAVDLIAALQARSPNLEISQASEALFIANITSRLALDKPQSNDMANDLLRSWTNALERMRSISPSTDQQSLATEKLASMIDSENLASRKAIKVIELASASLEN